MNDPAGFQLSQPLKHAPHDALDLLSKQGYSSLDEILIQIAAVERISDDIVAVFRLVDSFELQ